jgi:hypothetical protein
VNSPNLKKKNWTGSRKLGGGRKRLTASQPDIAFALDKIVDPATRGDPESPLRWTCKSTRKLAAELGEQDFQISRQSVAYLLKASGYSLQANRKTVEGKQHPDRNAQFEFINREAKKSIKTKQPFISVDTKKKENLGGFKNTGREWRLAKNPRRVDVHDFPDEHLGKAIPYGVYDIANNKGFVNVGITHDTAQFAVASIYAWYRQEGRNRFPQATDIFITADSGGSNSSRNRAWKFFLQIFASQTGLRVHVRHFPPGTSKWNKIEHRMFCHISANWRSRPLESLQTVLELIQHTTTKTGLKIKAQIDKRLYVKGLKISDELLGVVNLRQEKFHGEWNYTILP